MVTGGPRALLRLEGAAALVVALALYFGHGGSAWSLIPLLLAVDVSMLGYLRGPRLGAATYNAAHNFGPGFVVLGVGLTIASSPLVVAGSVLVAHVGMDRLFGYGLKYASSFHDTHLGHIGRQTEPQRP